MSLNQYNIYSRMSQSKKSTTEDVFKVLTLISELKNFDKEEEVKEWLKNHWNIKDDICNFSICDNICLSATTGKKYFNVTVKNEDKVKIYNFERQNERSE